MATRTGGGQPSMSGGRLRRRARFMRGVNVPMRRVLGLPFSTPISRRLMLLHLTGRKTGRAYRQPVSYMADGATLLSPGGGNWKRNLREGEPVRVRLRGRDRQAWPELVRDPDQIERLLGRMVAVNPRLTSFVPFVGRDGRVDRAGLSVAAARGFCIVRWHLDSLPPGGLL
jgi:deazaflavin-dependent oxidoreductase (nitroreductase family)